MTDTRSSKRARCTADTSGGEQNMGYKQSDAFWLRDGNIILVAEKVAFRVHQSVLERKSEVFRDMLGLPQPENADSESLEECALVHVSDAAEDIRHLLSVLYDGDRVLGRKSPISMKVVFALLQLAIKYEIDYLRDEAISILQTLYPLSYDEFVEQRQPKSALRITDRTENQDPIIIINLAWKHGLHSLLPGAFFACAKLSNKELIRATKGSGREDDLTRLSDEDLERCLNGRAMLQSQYFNRYSSYEQGECSFRCLQKHICGSSLDNHWHTQVLFNMKNILNFDFDPFDEIDWTCVPLCHQCRVFFEERDYLERSTIYGCLAETFRLSEVVQGSSDAETAD
ncbi:hypothetical protein EIP91_005096 [Steccherinum ochraceum]|uniref:BTB domain-containing protein n=1 Tax=Steccherinum ochraceum TaxID=92696 RepID=A0A4R0R7P6_9APHY|nr:hypothetical protein EIP91_005096 [Steccherinum ochraceum]